MKKIISSVLALAMVLCIFPFAGFSLTAFAASESDLTFELLEYGVNQGGPNGYMITGCDLNASGELVIPSEYNGKPVTQIGYEAFKDCTKLTSITVPDSVFEIMSNAFEGCTGLKTVVINDVPYINSEVFLGCTSLESVTLPNGIEKISYGMFKDCTSLEAAPIPNSVTAIRGSAFEGCTSLTSVTIPDSVAEIDQSAFKGCTGLASVTIPDSITYIKSSTFDNCTGLTSITIPDSVTSIGWSAFEGCTGLTFITIPDSVTSIGWYAFWGCKGLTSITIPNGVSEIEARTFENCTSLTSVTIPDSVTKIDNSAFENCTSLTSVTIPDSVTKINNSAFKNCTSLTSVTIPECVTDIGDNAFNNCNSELVITGYKYSAAYDYAYINGIDFISVGDGEQIIYNLNSEGDSYTLARCTVFFQGAVNVSSEYNGKPVTSIDSKAFKNCNAITSVTIPDSVRYIESSTFENCTGLTSIAISNSVTHIGSSAFENCTGLTSVTIPDSITCIESSTFENCTGLTSFKIPDSVTAIYGSAFAGCTGLTSVTIPDSITYIESRTFENCTGLTSFTIPDSVTAIYGSAFAGCTGLTSVTIPGSVTEIDSSAFNYCNPDLVIVTPAYSVAHDYARDNSIKFKLVGEADPLRYEKRWDWGTDDWVYGVKACSSVYSGEIIVPREYKGYSVTEILSGAFEGCTGITSITIPESVTMVSGDAFKGCTGIKEINVPADASYVDKELFEDTAFYKDDSNWENNVLYICGILVDAKENIAGTCVIKNGAKRIAKSAFADCTGITSVKIPDSVTYIGYEAFKDCTGLASVTMPGSVAVISDSAFVGCTGLTSVTIPDGVTYIGYEAFKDCTGLTSVTIPESVTYIGSDVFSNCSPDFAIKGYIYSEAYDYAVENSIKFISIGQIDPIRYKLNDNGEEFTVTGCSSVYSGDIVIPSEYKGKPVTELGYGAFQRNKNIVSVTIPGSVKYIGWYAFIDCENLKSVSIQEGVTEIGAYAFTRCSSLEKIELPDSLIVLGYQGVYAGEVFGETAYENNLDNWQDGVLYIGNHLIATKKDEVPANYKVKEGTKTISGYAFSGCENLKSISIPKSVVSIGPWAFDESGVKNDRSNWENGVFYVGKHAVATVGSLAQAELKIKEGTVSISALAFENCHFGSVHIPNTVKYIGHSAFLGCDFLNAAYIPESVTYIGHAAFGWSDSSNMGYGHDHDVMIYGYEGTEAERSAKSDGNTFVALDVKLADEESGIKVSGNIDEAAALEVKLLSSDKSKITYDITLTKDGKAIQPDGTVTVKIPVPESLDGAKCRVYRVEENGKNTDMNAEFKDGFMVFKTTHFSKYILTTDDLSVVYGDSNGDGKINTVDLAMLRKYLANRNPTTGESMVSVGAGADVNGDGKINTVDLAMLRKYLANKDPVTGESSVILGPKK